MALPIDKRKAWLSSSKAFCAITSGRLSKSGTELESILLKPGWLSELVKTYIIKFTRSK